MTETAAETERSTGSFEIVPIVISRYNAHPNLHQAEAEAEQVAAILSRWGGELLPWDVDEGKRTVEDTLARLQSWSRPTVSRSSLLLWIGHGSSNDGDAVVHLPAATTDVNLVPQQLAYYVAHEHRLRDEPDWTIVVFETCGGRRFAEQMQAELSARRVRDGILLIGSGEDRGEGYLGNFRRVLDQICEDYWSNDKVISVRDLANRFEDSLRPGFVSGIGLSNRSPLIPRHDLTPTLTTSVDFYPDLRAVMAQLPEADLQQLDRSGLGADLLEIGGHFVGRFAERTAIASWLEAHDTGMLVVTGGPGSGKSALLANLMLHAVPSLRVALENTPHLGGGWTAGYQLPPVDGALLLHGATIAEVATRLTQVADVALPADFDPSKQVTELLRLLAERAAPMTLFADALDEARDPLEIADLLARIAQLAGTRIVLATRPGPSVDADDFLRSLQTWVPDVTLIPLTDDRFALQEFATERLSSASPAVAAEDLAATAANFEECLANSAEASAGWDFLHVRLMVTELLATPGLVTSAHAAERRATMALDRGALFLRAVQRLTHAHPCAESLLLALACAQGRGLPRADRIWATVAKAIDNGHTFTEADVNQVLRVAGAYIMVDAEDGRSVFRLAHSTFADALSDRLSQQVHMAVLEALVELTGEVADPPPYLRRHLSGHANALGSAGWSVLGRVPGLLDQLDLITLLADTWRSPVQDLPGPVLAVRRTAHLALAGSDKDRRGYRQLGEAQEAGHLSAPAGAGTGAAWQVVKARLVRHPSHQTNSPGPPVPVRSLTACTIADGTMVVAFGNDHGQVSLWNPWEGSIVDLTQHTHSDGEILGLAILNGPRGPILASVGPQQPVRLWPLDGDRKPFGLPDRNGGTRCAVLASPIDKGALLAVGTTRGRLWLMSTEQAGKRRTSKPLNGHARRITGLATIGHPAGQHLVSVSLDCSLRRWSLPHGRRGPKAEWSRPLHSVAVAEQAGLVLTGDAAGVVTVWSLVELEPISSFQAHDDGPVHALSVVSATTGRTVVASGGADRRVRLWDVLKGAPVGPDLTGHDDEVTALAALRSPDGAPLVASGSRDGKVKIWTPVTDGTRPWPTSAPGRRSRREPSCSWTFPVPGSRTLTVSHTAQGRISCRPTDGPEVLLPHEANRARCAALFTAEGAVIVATGGSNVVHTWHAENGTPAGPPLKGHRDWVRVLLAMRPQEDLTVLVSGGDDGRVCLWDPASGDLLYHIDLGVAIQGLSAVPGTRRFAAAFDGGEIEIEVDEHVLRGRGEGFRW